MSSRIKGEHLHLLLVSVYTKVVIDVSQEEKELHENDCGLGHWVGGIIIDKAVFPVYAGVKWLLFSTSLFLQLLVIIHRKQH